MKIKKRRRLFIDRPVQGELIRRVILYWLLCMLVVTTMAVCWLVLPQDPASFGEFAAMTYNLLGPLLTTSVFVVPLIIIDLVRMSNRFAGPVYRLHREIRQLADGEVATSIQLRENDYWHEVANDYNRMLRRLQREAACQQAKDDDGIEEIPPSIDSELRQIAS